MFLEKSKARYQALIFGLLILCPMIAQAIDEIAVISPIQSDGCICTAQYEPVCANNGKTYGNPCLLGCARRQNPYIMGVCKGECPCCKEPYYNEPLVWPGWSVPAWYRPPQQVLQPLPQPTNGWKSSKMTGTYGR